MKPKITGSGEDGTGFQWKQLEVEFGFTDFASLGIHIAGTDPMRFAMWNGHQFETIHGVFEQPDAWGIRLRYPYEDGAQPHEYVAQIYFPIDPRIIETDVVNATLAYPNESNDGWLFAHCDADFMHDNEAKLVAALTDAFAPAHRQLAHKLHGLLVHNIVQREQDAALAKSENFEQFHTDTELNLRKWHRTQHIGHFHQRPHDAHVTIPIEAMINQTGKEWAKTKATKFQTILPEVSAVLARAAARHAYETRWDKAARIAAENKAAAARGVDPVDGYEFCYAAVVTNTPIVGAENLPDPTWRFDQLRDGAIDRGDYRYTDESPTGNAFQFIAIRFKRPIPAGTQPGADIGSVAWEQEPAHYLTTPSSS